MNDNPALQQRRANALGAFVIFLLALAVYWPLLRGGFVWDDLLLVKKNVLVTGELTPLTIWFSEDFPLSTVAMWLQWKLWGDNASGFHIVNVLLHALNAVLVWRVLAAMRTGGAWIAGALFAVHPVCVASAGWISEIKNTLSLLFFLLALLCSLRSEQNASGDSQSRSSPRPWYAFALAAFVLSLLSKTSTVTLPVVLLVVAWWRNGRIVKRDVLRAAPFFAVALAFGLMTVWFQNQQAIQGQPVQSENLAGRIAGAGHALWFYLGKALLPVNLCIIYPRWEFVPLKLFALLPALLWLALLIVLWKFRERRDVRSVLFALVCFSITLTPVLGILDMVFLKISRVSDHFQYLPLISILSLLAAAFDRFVPARFLRFAVVGIVAALSVLTLQRSRAFVSDESLWLDTLAKNPMSWNANNNLGCIRAEQNRMDEAIRFFEESLRLNPRNAKALVNLAQAALMRGDNEKARTHLDAALAIKNDDPDANAFYGSLLAGQGKFDAAVDHFRASLRSRFDPQVQIKLANTFRAAGDIAGAIATYRELLKSDADSLEALNNLAWMLATTPDAALRDGKEAVQHAERACRLTDFKQARPAGALAAAYAEVGRFQEAVSTAQRAVTLAQAAGDARFAAINQQLLKLYMTGRPFREPKASP